MNLSYICTEFNNVTDMTGNVITPQSPISLKYWEMLKNLSDNVKMELVAMLSNSVVYKEKAGEPELTKEERKRDLMALAGCWKDDPEDAARMEAAIKDGGTTIKSYTSEEGVHGRFQQNLNVHQRKDEECHICKSKIIKVVIGGRGTYYCEKCQKEK